MVYVKSGSFKMGSNDGYDYEKPVHRVTLTEDFYIGKYEVTQKLYKEVMGENPSDFIGDDLPVENVTWYRAALFCDKLSEKERLSKYYNINGIDVSYNDDATGYRLPTEAQWEYAARGGNKSKGYKYSGSDHISEVAWFWKNSGDKVLSGDWDLDIIVSNKCRINNVGTKQANELGIHDMSGNVWEWCQDWEGEYSKSNKRDPEGPTSGSYRLIRGGSWILKASDARSAYRAYNPPGIRNGSLGFRIVLPVQ